MRLMLTLLTALPMALAAPLSAADNEKRSAQIPDPTAILGSLPVVGSLASGLGGVTSILGGALPVARDLEKLSAPLRKRVAELEIDIRAELEVAEVAVKAREGTVNPATPLSEVLTAEQLQSLSKGSGLSESEIASDPMAALVHLKALAASNTERLNGGLAGLQGGN